MSKTVRFLPEAEAELVAAAEWYEERAGMGAELEAEVRSAVRRIVEMTRSFGPAQGVRADLGARQAPVDRFPYRVVFVDLGTEIRIVAIAHGRRRPDYWRRRVGDEGR